VIAGDEQPRLLHRDPARNYTVTPYLAARYEPEAVPADYQAQLSAQARRRDAERLGPAGGRPIRSATAAVARSAERVDRAVDELGGA
jgi:hypothetical protein